MKVAQMIQYGKGPSNLGIKITEKKKGRSNQENGQKACGLLSLSLKKITNPLRN